MYRVVECRATRLALMLPCGIERAVYVTSCANPRAPGLAPGSGPEKRLFASASSSGLFIALEFCRRTASRHRQAERGSTRRWKKKKKRRNEETKRRTGGARGGAVCEYGREKGRINPYSRYYTYTYIVSERVLRVYQNRRSFDFFHAVYFLTA